MADVFISYSRNDLEFVAQLRDALLSQTQEVWIDWEAIPVSQAWWNEIEKGIANAKNFVIILSPNSMASPICHMELEYARQLKKRIIPVLHLNYQREESILDITRRLSSPDQHIVRQLWGIRQPYDLFDANEAEIKRINYFTFSPQDEFNAKFSQLMQIIRTDYAYKERHAALEQRAREWSREQRKRSFLLSGGELSAARRWLKESGSKDPNPSLLVMEYIRASNTRRYRVLGTGMLIFSFVVATLVWLVYTNSQSVSQANEVAVQASALGQLSTENARTLAAFSRERTEQFAVQQMRSIATLTAIGMAEQSTYELVQLTATANAERLIQSGLVVTGEFQSDGFSDLIRRSQCTPLDVVILLDQSPSLTIKDATNHRIDATVNTIRLLYENAALRCPETEHRIGVIQFGDDAETLIPLSDGVIRVSNIDTDWQENENRLISRILPHQMSGTGLGAAIRLADEMFSESAFDDRSHFSQRVVILITDVIPCTVSALELNLPELGGVVPCQSPDWLQHYLTGDVLQLADYTGTQASSGGFDFPYGLEQYISTSSMLGENTSFNVIAFALTDNPIPQSVYNAWQLITNTHNGQYLLINDSSIDMIQITRTLDLILATAISSTPTPIINCRGTFLLEPYADYITVIGKVIDGDETGQWRLVSPDGNTLLPESALFGPMEIRYNKGTTIQRYIISNPMPGVWRIDDPSENCSADVSISRGDLIVNVLSPSSVIPVVQSPYYDESLNVIRLRMFSSSDRPYDQIDDFPLVISATITINPINAYMPIPTLPAIAFVYVGNGEWISETPLPAPLRGTYNIAITGEVESVVGNGARAVVFRTFTQYGTVEPTEINLEIVEPENGTQLSVEPLQFQVHFVDTAGVSHRLDQIFPVSDFLDEAVVAVLTMASDTAVRITVPLMPDNTDPYLLNGILNVPSEFKSGEYYLSVEITEFGRGIYNHENFALNTISDIVHLSLN